MPAPLTVPLEALVRAHAALQAVYAIPSGDPMPLAVSLKVAAALGYMNSSMEGIGRTPVAVDA